MGVKLTPKGDICKEVVGVERERKERRGLEWGAYQGV